MKKNIVKNIFQIILILILVVILINCCYQRFIEKKNLIKIFGFSLATINSGSMQPTLKVGEIILIKQIKNYSTGDIVIYEDDDKNLITHRIVDINEEVITKGDANNIEDNGISANKILGKVIFHSLFLGYVFKYGIKIIIFILVILIIISIIKNLIINKNQNRIIETVEFSNIKEKE